MDASAKDASTGRGCHATSGFAASNLVSHHPYAPGTLTNDTNDGHAVAMEDEESKDSSRDGVIEENAF